MLLWTSECRLKAKKCTWNSEVNHCKIYSVSFPICYLINNITDRMIEITHICHFNGLLRSTHYNNTLHRRIELSFIMNFTSRLSSAVNNILGMTWFHAAEPPWGARQMFEGRSVHLFACRSCRCTAGSRVPHLGEVFIHSFTPQLCVNRQSDNSHYCLRLRGV